MPDPGQARTLDDLVGRLRSLKMWAGEPSYDVITDRVNAEWTTAGRPAGELARRGTVVDCFKPGRRRINTDLFLAVVHALHPDAGYVAQWRQALRVVLGETQAAAQVRAQDKLPPELTGFTGRAAELDALRRSHEVGGAVVISAIEGMAGVGKTQLAVHAGHVLARERPFGRVLFVNLRGFDPDPAQPPVDPAAVLDGFLRLLGVPGQQIPHDLAARAALFRQRLVGSRALVVLDNAADEQQVRPLLPDSPGCLTLVTSRRRLAGLSPAVHLVVDAFTPAEAVDFLNRAELDVPAGSDPDAAARVAQRCGHLPLALSLVAGQMRAKPEWTLTDHADWLDERHRNRRLDSGVQLALNLSYQHVPPQRQRMLRLLALHPGHDLDRYAAAALADTDPDTAAAHLHQLCDEHLLQEANPYRYVFHDLVRAYAADRAADEDRPQERRAALTRLLDHYLHTAATAVGAVYPVEQHRGHGIPIPTTATPPVTDPAAARGWLDTERTNLTAAAVHAAVQGWPEHGIRLAAVLYRYLATAGHYTDAAVLHGHAASAARHSGDRAAEAHALTNLGAAHWRLGRYQEATDHYQQALTLFGEATDRRGEARVLNNLGNIHWRLGHYRQAADLHRRALTLTREIGDRGDEARALTGLGIVYRRLGHHRQAADHHERALALYREIGLRAGEADALTNLGTVHELLGNYRQSADHHEQALALYREIGDRDGEVHALNGLGETLRAAGQPDLGQHTTALTVADQIGNRYERARAHNGLAHTHRATGDTDRARQHWRHALADYTELGVPEADEVRGDLAALDPDEDNPGGGR